MTKLHRVASIVTLIWVLSELEEMKKPGWQAELSQREGEEKNIKDKTDGNFIIWGNYYDPYYEMVMTIRKIVLFWLIWVAGIVSKYLKGSKLVYFCSLDTIVLLIYT